MALLNSPLIATDMAKGYVFGLFVQQCVLELQCSSSSSVSQCQRWAAVQEGLNLQPRTWETYARARTLKPMRISISS